MEKEIFVTIIFHHIFRYLKLRYSAKLLPYSWNLFGFLSIKWCVVFYWIWAWQYLFCNWRFTEEENEIGIPRVSHKVPLDGNLRTKSVIMNCWSRVLAGTSCQIGLVILFCTISSNWRGRLIFLLPTTSVLEKLNWRPTKKSLIDS